MRNENKNGNEVETKAQWGGGYGTPAVSEKHMSAILMIFSCRLLYIIHSPFTSICPSIHSHPNASQEVLGAHFKGIIKVLIQISSQAERGVGLQTGIGHRAGL